VSVSPPVPVPPVLPDVVVSLVVLDVEVVVVPVAESSVVDEVLVVVVVLVLVLPPLLEPESVPSDPPSSPQAVRLRASPRAKVVNNPCFGSMTQRIPGRQAERKSSYVRAVRLFRVRDRSSGTGGLRAWGRCTTSGDAPADRLPTIVTVLQPTR
jgi:hypothetical protein